MQNLLQQIVRVKRYSSAGKDEFVQIVEKWGRVNLSNFTFEVEKSFFVFNFRELFKIIFIMLNFTIAFYILDDLKLPEIIENIVITILIYTLQFRIIFFFLSLLIPSKNIILSKKCDEQRKNGSMLVVCAHYDTKNSLFKKRKGIIKSFLKYHFLNISRILSGLIAKSNKVVTPIFALIYTMYLISPVKSVETASFLSYPKGTVSFGLSIGGILFMYGFICSLIILILTLPFGKRMKNPGADDNASGTAAALEIGRRLNDVKLDFDLKVVLFDNEERGLIGSSHFAAKHFSLLKSNNAKVINFDCIGRGDDVFILSDNMNRNPIFNKIKAEMRNRNIDYNFSNMDFTDHKSFSQEGIQSISFGRYDCRRFLWNRKFPVIDWIHGSEDVLEDIDAGKIEEIVDVVVCALKDCK